MICCFSLTPASTSMRSPSSYPVLTGTRFALPFSTISSPGPSAPATIAALGTTSASLCTSTTTRPRAAVFARKTSCPFATLTRASTVPVAGSATDPTAATLPGTRVPGCASVSTVAGCPSCSKLACEGATGACSSSTSTRVTSTIIFDGSTGSPAAAATFATTPSKGALSSARSSWLRAVDSAACAVRTAARADSSCKRASSTSCCAATPAASASRARDSLVAALDACARAWTSCASACCTAARREVASRRASGWPERTRSPSVTSTCASRPATSGPIFTSKPGSASSVPARSTTRAMSPRATCAIWTETTTGSSFASSAFLQLQSRMAEAKTLEIRTDGLLQVGERLLRVERRVEGATVRGGQVVLRLQDRDQRSAADAISSPRHLENAVGGLEERAAVESRPRRCGRPALAGGAHLTREPLRCGLCLQPGPMGGLLLLVYAATVEREQRHVEGNSAAKAEADGRVFVSLRDHAHGGQGADRGTLLVRFLQRDLLLPAERLQLRVALRTPQQLVLGRCVGPRRSLQRLHGDSDCRLQFATGCQGLGLAVQLVLGRAPAGEQALLDLDLRGGSHAQLLPGEIGQLGGDARCLCGDLRLLRGSPGRGECAPHGRVQLRPFDLRIRLGHSLLGLRGRDRCASLAEDGHAHVHANQELGVVLSVAGRESRVGELARHLDSRARDVDSCLRGQQSAVATVGQCTRLAERERGGEQSDEHQTGIPPGGLLSDEGLFRQRPTVGMSISASPAERRLRLHHPRSHTCRHAKTSRCF